MQAASKPGMHGAPVIRGCGKALGRHARLAAVSLAMGLLLPGCMLWTSHRAGEQLRRESQAQEERIARLEKGLEQERARLQAEIAELEQVLERATQVVKRNSADAGAQVEQLREQLAALQGEIAELRHDFDASKLDLSTQVEELEQRFDTLGKASGVATLPPDEIPADKAAHFAAAQRAHEAGEHPRALGLLKAFLERYPRDAHAPQARYLVGASYLAEGRPATALGEYRKILEQHPRSNIIDRTLLDMATSFYELHACSDAKSALEALLKRRPRRDVQQQAKQKLREVRKAPASYCSS